MKDQQCSAGVTTAGSRSISAPSLASNSPNDHQPAVFPGARPKGVPNRAKKRQNPPNRDNFSSSLQPHASSLSKWTRSIFNARWHNFKNMRNNLTENNFRKIISSKLCHNFSNFGPFWSSLIFTANPPKLYRLTFEKRSNSVKKR